MPDWLDASKASPMDGLTVDDAATNLQPMRSILPMTRGLLACLAVGCASPPGPPAGRLARAVDRLLDEGDELRLGHEHEVVVESRGPGAPGAPARVADADRCGGRDLRTARCRFHGALLAHVLDPTYATRLLTVLKRTDTLSTSATAKSTSAVVQACATRCGSDEPA